MLQLIPACLAVTWLGACASAITLPSSTAPASTALASTAAAPGASLPVREVSVFKDGHAFVVREARVPLDASGGFVLDDLPMPVLGTFWPYARGGAKLASATAATERVTVRRTALELEQLIEANSGADVDLVDVANEHTRGKLLGIPARSASELERTDTPSATPKLPQRGTVVLIRTLEGTKVIPLARVRDVSFAGDAKSELASEELRQRLTLRCTGVAPGASPDIGLMYVQHGLRWIPAYKLDVDGAGRVRVELEATLVNDLVDLDDAIVNLVVGVPRFEFRGQVDPIALQALAAELGRHMDPTLNFASNALSNAIMTQAAGYGGRGAEDSAPVPEVAGGAANEDLFVFKLQHVTMRRGERLVLPVTAFDLGYRDAYTLDVPFDPPLAGREQLQSDRLEELARALAEPKVEHVLRLKNDSAYPLTTAPALLFSKGKVVSQALLTYTPIGAETDVALATAVDVRVESSDVEAGRTPNAVNWNGHGFQRIDVDGTLTLASRKMETIEVEVTRSVLGLVDNADHGGTTQALGPQEFWRWNSRPAWWGWWSWPYGWWHWNGVGRFTWRVKLAPGESVGLKARWHYFWE